MITMTVGSALQEWITGSTASNELTILCPFHDDHRPSLRVNQLTGLFQCKSCPAQGDFLTLYGKLKKISPLQAAMLLPNLRISLPQEVEQEDEAESIRKAALYYSYRERIPWDKVSHHYLFERGFTPQQCNAEGIRIHPGMVYPLVLPLYCQNKFVGYQRRRLDGEKPKYLNNRGYKKEKYLVGKGLKRGIVTIVEGRLDEMMCTQRGVPNVGATLGDSISEEQVAFLANIAEGVIIASDNDTAGDMLAEQIALGMQRYRIPTQRIRYPSQEIHDPADQKWSQQSFLIAHRRALHALVFANSNFLSKG